jgi:hypothetical protein
MGHILHGNFFLKHVIEGKINGGIGVTGGRKRRRKRITVWPKGNEGVIGTECGSTESLSVENSLWKGLWTCRKTEFRMKD